MTTIKGDKITPVWVGSQKIAKIIMSKHPEYFTEQAEQQKVQYELNKVLKGLIYLEMVDYKGRSLDRSYKLNNLGLEYCKFRMK